MLNEYNLRKIAYSVFSKCKNNKLKNKDKDKYKCIIDKYSLENLEKPIEIDFT